MLSVLTSIYIINLFLVHFITCNFQGLYPPGCDSKAALTCEQNFLLCKLFNGPANDQATLCNCASEFYGVCLREAGVSYLLTVKDSIFV